MLGLKEKGAALFYSSGFHNDEHFENFDILEKRHENCFVIFLVHLQVFISLLVDTLRFFIKWCKITISFDLLALYNHFGGENCKKDGKTKRGTKFVKV